MSDVQVYVRNVFRETMGSIDTWESLSVSVRRNDVSTWTLVTTDADTAAILTPRQTGTGSIEANRGVILRRQQDNGDYTTFLSGWLSKEPDVEHDGGLTTWTFTGYDDTYLLLRAIIFPVYDAPADEQTDTHDVEQGPASNRIRQYFLHHVALRMGVPGATGGNQLDLGPNRKSQARFKGLLEHTQDIAARHLNFQIRQRDSDRALFLYQWLPVDKRLDVQFSPALGTVQSWSRKSTETTCNRVVIGVGGQGVNRKFRQYDNTADQDIWGIVEQFKDRRDLQPDEDPEWEQSAQNDADEFLEENRSRATFTIGINGAPDLRPFVHYDIGDLVRAYIDQDEDSQPVGLVEDLIEQLDVTWSADGEEGEVQIGAPNADLDEDMARMVRKAIRRISDLERRE